MDKKSKAQKIALSGILIGISVIFGTFSIPIGVAKISPVQHFVNVVGAIALGPLYACANGFIAALLRNVLGTGSLLAFPGSMIGGLVAGILYNKFKKTIAAVIGEIIGTGILGAIIAYPVAILFLGKEAALFTYIIPFTLSCSAGSIIAYFFLKVPAIKKTLINNQYLIMKKSSKNIEGM
ncbi:energy coupling factor transporter S component ThiW [Clostridium uliginosum]|uniref:Energy coupling factor transporter S component ThiW n=1 Tax=Clostridium uliginosum TaxID=119641 RepID=A0A1I1N627_9CLOT|nr:energy coupling factor transporter S component ThiW [Clostridium uliginosum]SFC93131.1 energy coupling factor transporter S component ThiW [Clostridium uliginosum]